MSTPLSAWICILALACQAGESPTSGDLEEASKNGSGKSNDGSSLSEESDESGRDQRPESDPAFSEIQTDIHQAEVEPNRISDVLATTPVLPTREAVVPMRLPSSKRVEEARTLLRGLIELHGRDASRPAVLIHSLLALGPDTRTTDDRQAIDALFSDWAIRLNLSGEYLIQFPRKSGDTMVEAHRGIILKTLSEIGTSPDYPVQVEGHAFTLARLYQTAMLQTWASMSGEGISPIFSSPQDMPWVLQGLSAWSPPSEMSWKTIEGHTQTLDDFAIFNFAVLHHDTQPLFLTQNEDSDIRKKQDCLLYTSPSPRD